MARLAVDDDGPRRVGARRLAPQLAVDEVADAPANNPNAVHGAMKSVTTKNGCLICRPKSHIATSTPTKPPWNDMPPCHTLRMLSGSAMQLAQAVDEHVADAAADDRAERAVEHDVVDVLGLDPAPRLLGVRAPAEPAEREADEVHEPVPAHLERPDRERNGIEVRIRKQTITTRAS